ALQSCTSTTAGKGPGPSGFSVAMGICSAVPADDVVGIDAVTAQPASVMATRARTATRSTARIAAKLSTRAGAMMGATLSTTGGGYGSQERSAGQAVRDEGPGNDERARGAERWGLE